MKYMFEEVLLEVESHPNKINDFYEEYRIRTGELPPLFSIQNQENKWGIETRVYFNAPADTVRKLKNLYTVESGGRGYNDDYEYRINTRDFFWEMVDLGYRLK